jgi:hypothetical protein
VRPSPQPLACLRALVTALVPVQVTPPPCHLRLAPCRCSLSPTTARRVFQMATAAGTSALAHRLRGVLCTPGCLGGNWRSCSWTSCFHCHLWHQSLHPPTWVLSPTAPRWAPSQWVSLGRAVTHYSGLAARHLRPLPRSAQALPSCRPSKQLLLGNQLLLLVCSRDVAQCMARQQTSGWSSCICCATPHCHLPVPVVAVVLVRACRLVVSGCCPARPAGVLGTGQVQTHKLPGLTGPPQWPTNNACGMPLP